MSDPQMASDFEERFRRALRSYAGEGIGAYDPALISERARTVSGGPRRWWLEGRPLPIVEPRVLRVALLLGVLAAALLLAFVGSRRADPPLPRPGLLAVGSSNRIVTIDPWSGALRPLTNATANDGEPVWSPDGTRIAFSQDDGRGPLEIIDTDGIDVCVVDVRSSPAPVYLKEANDRDEFFVRLAAPRGR